MIKKRIKLKALKLLLVEDASILLQIQMQAFESYGHQVEGVTSGQRALEILKKDAFDVILMDLVMPEMDGFECVKQIKAMGIETPIIALSGNDDAPTQQACFNAGMVGFLKKPTNQEAFNALIEAKKLKIGHKC